MTTALIIIAIAAVLLLAALVLLPRARAKAQYAKRERELSERRDAAAGMHASAAEQRMAKAERYERAARAEKAEAQMHGEHAELHRHGLADDRLVRDDEPDLRDHVRERLDRDDDGRLDADDLKPSRFQRDDAAERVDESSRRA